jgi:hypothetical protein
MKGDTMISSYEFKTDTIKVIGEKLRRTDAVEDAIDRVLWKQAVKRLDLVIDEPYVYQGEHLVQGVGRLKE